MDFKFSDRIGKTSPPVIIQLDDMNESLSNSIWNLIFYTVGSEYYTEIHYKRWRNLTKIAGYTLFNVPVDSIPHGNPNTYKWFREQFFNSPWYEKYNILEFVAGNITSVTGMRRQDFADAANRILEAELSGYRFIAGILSPISNPEEVSAIEGAIKDSEKKGIGGIHEHLNQSLKCLGQKPEPDYRNAIKEAISAVESAVISLCGNKGRDFEGAIKELSNKIHLHGALQGAFIKLYGYTSDEDGIRHAILEDKDIDYDEAKFMVVVCSAFINYLISRAGKEGLIK